MSKIESLDASDYKNEAYEKDGTTHCLGCIPGTGDWQAVDSRPFLEDGEVVGLCIASDIGPQLKIVLVEEQKRPIVMDKGTSKIKHQRQEVLIY
jgi:hypothetical protein